ncbi:glycosyl transferase family 10 (putative fucosyltransferase) [Algoriphagus boseongensis]|uniref:Glycosyl transferase family 10 (Putative fucosyltransferase) n=1 Tax=Algoriphagus boseongensis TaxID=1442587 RepID=A0A4R6TBF8_9BACT|nr:glycosyltransferase family 10 [Algoriphagus boseongensis]TDQ19583.1 glycosyl transferase family 10 (putative fucosyltransferase) [Algoriphagus boseongensis]
MIRLKFVDHYQGFVPETDRLFTFLKRYFPVVLVEESPDFIIYSSWGGTHLDYNCPKIFYTGENHRPNFFLCDYALGFDFIDRPNYLRVPLYSILWYYDFSTLLFPKHLETIQQNPKSKFCCFVASNYGADERNKIFKKLSSYALVDSGGRVLNNVGGPVPDKIEFMRPYKFCIAYENSSYPGYVTEKIMDCFIAGCIPIYWGSPCIEKDFNPKRIVNRHNFASDEAMIQRIRELNENEEAYKDFIKQPIFNGNQLTEYFDQERLRIFFEQVFEGPKTTRSIGVKKSIGLGIRQTKIWESKIKRKIGGFERVWY